MRRIVSAACTVLAGLFLPLPALAQPSVGERVFVNVNALVQSSQARLTVQTPVDTFGQRGSLRVDDDIAESGVVDIGAAVRVFRGLVVGASYSRTDSTNFHPFTAVGPSPFAGHPPITMSAVANGVEHREEVVYVSISWLQPMTDRFDVVAAAGPAFFDVRQDIPFTTAVRTETLALFTLPTLQRSDASVVGLHASLDLNYMLANRLGGGVLLRYSRASVDPPHGTSPLIVGGLQIGVGVRARF